MQYRLTVNYHIEARSFSEAKEELILANGVQDYVKTFDDETVALYEYNRIAKDLDTPYKLASGLYWFEGVMLQPIEDDESGDPIALCVKDIER